MKRSYRLLVISKTEPLIVIKEIKIIFRIDKNHSNPVARGVISLYQFFVSF